VRLPVLRADWADALAAVLLTDNMLFEYILKDDVFFSVVGILECKARCEVLSRADPSQTIRNTRT
jgi:hypothetical protein